MERLETQQINGHTTIRAVVNVYPSKCHQQTHRRQIVLTQTTKLQQQLMDILHLTPDQSDFRVTPPAI